MIHAMIQYKLDYLYPSRNPIFFFNVFILHSSSTYAYYFCSFQLHRNLVVLIWSRDRRNNNTSTRIRKDVTLAEHPRKGLLFMIHRGWFSVVSLACAEPGLYTKKLILRNCGKPLKTLTATAAPTQEDSSPNLSRALRPLVSQEVKGKPNGL